MRSSALLDERRHDATVPRVQDLLVLWQHPGTREITPIGRFRFDGVRYTFAYARGAATIADLRPLPGLDDLGRRYESERMPAVFEQRVMDADRPDYDAYIHSLGLDASVATPWEQIVESEGTRAGDTLQFMQVPYVVGGRARARFLANGVRHIPGRTRNVAGRAVTVTADEQESALRSLRVGDTLLAEPELENPVDPGASLLTVRGTPVGWVPRALSTSLRELMGSQGIPVSVARIGEPGSPPHLRLVLDLDQLAPPDFHFDRERTWEPLAETTQ